MKNLIIASLLTISLPAFSQVQNASLVNERLNIEFEKVISQKINSMISKIESINSFDKNTDQNPIAIGYNKNVKEVKVTGQEEV